MKHISSIYKLNFMPVSKIDLKKDFILIDEAGITTGYGLDE
jgi:hypothetical protein